ncbi:hypothetical protein IV203_015351 [Nitzschia inconspicua]|uniref:Uncharacterized protein n=1 Tax=Nitzschia inconspicua TaxID=303405 RepID=A0A9K3LAU7_9STRA|nr:hypothetical protein IV203_015351 [Nitzschia inconspicua]
MDFSTIVLAGLAVSIPARTPSCSDFIDPCIDSLLEVVPRSIVHRYNLSKLSHIFSSGRKCVVTQVLTEFLMWGSSTELPPKLTANEKRGAVFVQNQIARKRSFVLGGSTK